MKTVILKVVSAIVIAGQIVPASRRGEGGLSLIEVAEDEARDLLNRGKVEVPTDAELAEAGFTLPERAADFDPSVASNATPPVGGWPAGDGFAAAHASLADTTEDPVAAAALAAATPAAPVDALVQVGDATVAVQVVGQAEDGSPIVTDASGAALEAAADAAQASQDAAQGATADAGTSDQANTADAAQGAAKADKPATKPRGNKSAGK